MELITAILCCQSWRSFCDDDSDDDDRQLFASKLAFVAMAMAMVRTTGMFSMTH